MSLNKSAEKGTRTAQTTYSLEIDLYTPNLKSEWYAIAIDPALIERLAARNLEGILNCLREAWKNNAEVLLGIEQASRVLVPVSISLADTLTVIRALVRTARSASFGAWNLDPEAREILQEWSKITFAEVLKLFPLDGIDPSNNEQLQKHPYFAILSDLERTGWKTAYAKSHALFPNQNPLAVTNVVSQTIPSDASFTARVAIATEPAKDPPALVSSVGTNILQRNRDFHTIWKGIHLGISSVAIGSQLFIPFEPIRLYISVGVALLFIALAVNRAIRENEYKVILRDLECPDNSDKPPK